MQSGYHTWKPYLLSIKPSAGRALFAIAALIGIVSYLRTRRRLGTASGNPTPIVPISVKPEGLAHLAGSSNKSVVDEVKRRLTVGRDQRTAGLLGGLWNETKKAIGDTIQMAGHRSRLGITSYHALLPKPPSRRDLLLRPAWFFLWSHVFPVPSTHVRSLYSTSDIWFSSINIAWNRTRSVVALSLPILIPYRLAYYDGEMYKHVVSS